MKRSISIVSNLCSIVIKLNAEQHTSRCLNAKAHKLVIFLYSFGKTIQRLLIIKTIIIHYFWMKVDRNRLKTSKLMKIGILVNTSIYLSDWNMKKWEIVYSCPQLWIKRLILDSLGRNAYKYTWIVILVKLESVFHI